MPLRNDSAAVYVIVQVPDVPGESLGEAGVDEAGGDTAGQVEADGDATVEA